MDTNFSCGYNIKHHKNLLLSFAAIIKISHEMRSQENDSLHPQARAAFILDNQPLFSESFRCLLNTMSFFTRVVQSIHEQDLWKSLETTVITHLFIDYNLTDLTVSDILNKIRKSHPRVKTIVLLSSQNFFIAQRMIKCGATGLLSKSTSIAELAVCLRTLEIGRKYISTDIRSMITEHANILHPVNFTDKEIQVLHFIAKGLTIVRIAERLKISKHTVIAHRRSMMGKAGLNSAASLVKFGMEAGLIKG